MKISRENQKEINKLYIDIIEHISQSDFIEFRDKLIKLGLTYNLANKLCAIVGIHLWSLIWMPSDIRMRDQYKLDAEMKFDSEASLVDFISKYFI